MSTYSFLDVNATISGPGGSIRLGSGSGAAKEGITIVPVEDKSTMLTGADGEGQHSLNASSASTVTVNLLKTSPVNAQLAQMFAFQTSSGARHGRNVLTITNFATGDIITLEKAAFKRQPDVNYATEAGIMSWQFDAIRTSVLLGTGTPEV